MQVNLNLIFLKAPFTLSGVMNPEESLLFFYDMIWGNVLKGKAYDEFHISCAGECSKGELKMYV